MREIKFRFYPKNQITNFQGKTLQKMWEATSIDFEENEISNGGDIFSLNEVELMQYTGLKDINWKEIYEWDIVKWFYNYSVEINKAVVWFRIGRFEINTFRCIPLYEFLLWNETKLEIIWNIYENPELLTK